MSFGLRLGTPTVENFCDPLRLAKFVNVLIDLHESKPLSLPNFANNQRTRRQYPFGKFECTERVPDLEVMLAASVSFRQREEWLLYDRFGKL
jgi:hypothetical protein